MAAAGHDGLLRLPRSAHELPGPRGFPPSRLGPLEAHAVAAQPEGQCDVGADAETRPSLAPAAANPSPLARAALRRQAPEVGAECVNRACSALCGGCAAMRIPTANRIGRQATSAKIHFLEHFF